MKFNQELLQQGISVSDVSSKGLPKLITDTMYHHKQGVQHFYSILIWIILGL